MKSIVSFKKEEFAILMGVLTKQTKAPSINFIYHRKLKKLDFHRKGYVKNVIDDLQKFIKDDQFDFREIYLMMVILSGKKSGKFLTPIYSLFDLEELSLLEKRYQKPGRPREILDQLIKLDLMKNFMHNHTHNKIKRHYVESPMVIVNQCKEFFKAIPTMKK